ncbi:acetyl-CoA carboxylase biotin carboxyl carrier protein [soil metagenome]
MGNEVEKTWRGRLPQMSKLDLDLVKHALTTARDHGFAEVELSLGEDTFSAVLKGKPKPKASASPVEDIPVATAPGSEIKSSLVGYYKPAKTPLAVGLTVSKGDVVAVITALGIPNDIESPASGTISEVLVEPNQPVEFGQVLARIDI